MARPIVRNVQFSGLSVNFSGPPGGFVWTVQVTVPKAQPYQSYLILLNGVQVSSMQGTAVYGPIQLYQGDELTITNNAGGVDAGQSGILYGQIDAEGHQPSGVFPAVSGGTVQTTGLNQIIWQGIWDSATTYQVNDLVEYDGSSYIAIAVNSDTVPTNTSFWNLVAEEGAQGPAGPTGPAGPVGMKWTGAWSSTTAYAVGDGVYQNGSSYICTVANTNEPPPDTGFWSALAEAGTDGTNGTNGVSVMWQGSWSNSTAYVVNDAVSYNGASYICILANTGESPTNTTYWNEMAAAGSGTNASEIQGVNVATTAPTSGQVLAASGIPDLDQAILALSPTAYWKLADPAGTTAPIDSSGHGLTGTVVGTVTFGEAALASGQPGETSALTSAAGGYVEGPLPSGAGTTNQTILSFFEMPSTSTNGAIFKLGTGGDGFAIGIGGTTFSVTGTNVIALYDGIRWIATTTTVTAGIHMLALVIDSSGYPEIFLDGTSIYSDSGATAAAPSANSYIGTDPYDVSTETWGDLVGYAASFDVALTSAQIADIYAAASHSSSLEWAPATPSSSRFLVTPPTYYAPSTQVDYTLPAQAALAALDTTNLTTGSFTAPESGRVLVTVNAAIEGDTVTEIATLGLFYHNTTTQAGYSSLTYIAIDNLLLADYKFLITGLTPGSSYQFDLAGSAGTGGGDVTLRTVGATGTSVSNATPCTITVEAA